MMYIRNILVLCEGNHCRSPFAATLLQAGVGSEFTINSAGLAAMIGHPAHQESIRGAMELGLDLSSHKGKSFSAGLVRSADLILVMDQAQKHTCEQLVPSSRGRVYLLGHWLPVGEQEIGDPIGESSEVHSRSHKHICRALAPWLVRLNAPRKGSHEFN